MAFIVIERKIKKKYISFDDYQIIRTLLIRIVQFAIL